MRLILIILFLANCSPKKDQSLNSEKIEKTERKPEFNFDIIQFDYIQFRRNYFYGEETYKNKKLIEKLNNRNPERINGQGNFLKKFDIGFDSLNLFDGEGNFNIKVWEKISKTNPKKIKIGGNDYLLSIKCDNEEGFDFEIKTHNNLILTKKHFRFGFPPDVSFYVYDFDNDNQDEIISMYHWYIINGDNYDFNIYEISKNLQ
ncbi:MAG: hypothetical protein QM737_18200 [Ferruginibacter sp.]